MQRVFGSIVLLVIFVSSGFARDDDSTYVLFIGNSYTYYHSMPQLFKAMAGHHFPGHQTDIKFIGHGGVTLKQQWEVGEALKEFRSGRWDYVVLQEQSMLGNEIIENGKSYIRSPDLFFEYAGKFAQEIEKSGAKTVFYMTWSRKEYPQQQKYLTYAYMHIAEETGSKIAPVGMVWDELRAETGFSLYEKDGSHPSIHGSYLAALMLFSVIFETDPSGTPGRLTGYEILKGGKISDEKRLLCNLPESDVKIIQNAVSNTFQNLRTGNGYLEVKKAVSDKKPSQFSMALTYLNDSKNQFLVLIIIAAMVLIIKGGILIFKNSL